MKKNFRFAFVGAIALLGAVGISSCSSSSDEVINNPNYNAETNSVKAQFAISIPTSGGGASTRMDADGAPSNNVFKGMKDIKLYPITTVDATTKTALSTSAISAPNALDPISDFNQKGSGNNSFNGNVYSEVDIPVGTKAFVFYGEITNEKGGDLTPNYATSGTIGNVNFSLVPIQTATFATLSDTDGNAVLAALNGIVTELKSQADAATTATHASAPHLTALLQIFQSLKAGSATTVRAFVENVYNQLTDLGTTYDATTYTNAIQDKIKEHFTVAGAGPYTLTWTAANTFPSALGLPDGAVGVSCNTTTNSFAFASAIVDGNSQPELNTYVKPASLFYTVNTPIHTSTTAQVSNYATQTSWANVVALYNQGTEVVANTRAVVLDNPIEYGVARLASNVILNSTLKANDINGNDVVVTPPATGYSVTGILIGTQKNVDWKFEPTGATSYTIYDPVQTGGSSVKATTTAASPVNYTLALQTAVDEEIKVVVEMVNEGDPFYGIENQLIPKNSKFYLIAKLLPSAATNYNASDNTKNKVFCQDVETTVTFTVGETSLKKAYNTIPDLRAAKMELGLSVDLSWKPGLSFGINLGNN